MTSDPDRTNFQDKLRTALHKVDAGVSNVHELAEEARKKTYYDELGVITDRIRFYQPHDAQNIFYSAQSLVNRKMPFAARDVLLAARALVAEGEPAWFELQGLLGRCAKQIFLDSSDRTTRRARQFLDEAITAYRTGFDKDPNKAFWHGGNIAALLTIARRMGGPPDFENDPVVFSLKLRQVLDNIPLDERDVWYNGTFVEAELGAENWEGAANRLKVFLDSAPDAFPIESLLRQLTEAWAMDGPATPPMIKTMVAFLRARLLKLTGTDPVQVSAGEIAVMPSMTESAPQDVAEPSAPLSAQPSGQRPTAFAQARTDLEKAFSDEAPRLLDWWRLGEIRAKSVAAICTRNELGDVVRVGSGFLVKLRDVNTRESADCCVLTNAHVISDLDPRAAIRACADGLVRFEGNDPQESYAIEKILWTSLEQDATLLVVDYPKVIQPIPMNRQLPAANSGDPLYIIGHPAGNELAFSFRDNQLLDHEGPPEGKPRFQGVAHVHYRTPTRGGSSGSPVFVEMQWRAIALHHAGNSQMERLNGKPGVYEANEGISLASISAALSAAKALEFWF